MSPPFSITRAWPDHHTAFRSLPPGGLAFLSGVHPVDRISSHHRHRATEPGPTFRSRPPLPGLSGPQVGAASGAIGKLLPSFGCARRCAGDSSPIPLPIDRGWHWHLALFAWRPERRADLGSVEEENALQVRSYSMAAYARSSGFDRPFSSDPISFPSRVLVAALATLILPQRAGRRSRRVGT